MVLKELVLMSKSSSDSQAPKPPSVEEILSDLQNSDSQDVAFEHPSEVCPDVRKLKGHSFNLNNDREHARHESQASYLPTQNTGITTGEDLNRGQDEEKYKYVTEFLSNYQSLVKSSTSLKKLGKELEEDRHKLEQKIDLVEESWKTVQDEKM